MVFSKENYMRVISKANERQPGPYKDGYVYPKEKGNQDSDNSNNETLTETINKPSFDDIPTEGYIFGFIALVGLLSNDVFRRHVAAMGALAAVTAVIGYGLMSFTGGAAVGSVFYLLRKGIEDLEDTLSGDD